MVALSLSRIRSDFLLQANLGVGAGGVFLESVWQMEFYRAATSALSVTSHISPSVGHLFGSTGQLDFYVNGNKRWLIEITRTPLFPSNLSNIGEGSLLQEHSLRFQPPNGRYCNIPCVKSVVLDFRKVRPPYATIQQYGDLVWFVVYNETLSQATLVRKDQEDYVITFATPPLTKEQEFKRMMENYTKSLQK